MRYGKYLLGKHDNVIFLSWLYTIPSKLSDLEHSNSKVNYNLWPNFNPLMNVCPAIVSTGKHGTKLEDE